MSRVVIVGGGLGGLLAGLLLGRLGHSVVVCERDAAAVPATPEEMWSSWPRPGTPQTRLGHGFLAGFRAALLGRLPDVVEAALAGGVQVEDCARDMPGDERRPEDAELVAFSARRPTLEGLLRQIVEAEPNVVLVPGCRVTGLMAEQRGGVPWVRGVAVAGGDAILGDVVVLSGGRTVPVVRWFSEMGADVAESAENCGFACYTRYFRLRDGGEQVEPFVVRGDPGYVLYELSSADAGTFAAEIIVPVKDRPLHALREPTAWTAAALTVPGWPAWIDAGRSQPISPGVEVMGQERNVRRAFVHDGRPVALGVHVIGDARCSTDSLWAWGCAHTMHAAMTVADAIQEHPTDLEAQALLMSSRVDAELAGRWELSRDRDRAWHRRSRGEDGWDDLTSGAGLIDGILYPASEKDADVYRAVTRWEQQLDRADALDSNQAIIHHAKSIRDGTRPPTPTTTDLPTRDEMITILTRTVATPA